MSSTGFPSIRILILVAVASTTGCIRETGAPATSGNVEAVWGRKGISPGRFQKPRAIAIDQDDQLYIVDMTARIQVFTADGQFLRSWKTPTSANGRPTGLTVTNAGRLLVADTHYFRVLSYTLDGKLIPSETLGGSNGHEPGEFGFVTDALRDSAGNLFVSEYGDYPRIQKFSPEGAFLLQWGSFGEEPGQFRRPQNLALDHLDQVWVADACNHRIQIFDNQGRFIRMFGGRGDGVGELYYPYDLVLDEEGHVFVCEYGNHRIQKFAIDGRPIAVWGSQGRGEGELFNPWAIVRDTHGCLHVLDSNNHRVQRVRL